MSYKKEKFVIIKKDLSKEIDVDDSAGRSVPINMNFVETGYLSKDTGSSLYGVVETSKAHSPFEYKQKDGTTYFIRVLDTKLQTYNTTTGVWDDLNTIGTATITIATPGVITSVAHGLILNSTVVFSTTGALPTGITPDTVYYVISSGLTVDNFQISETVGGAAINTSGTQSGVHTISRSYTADKEFGYVVYDDKLYCSNTAETPFTWDGTTFADVAAIPKGNILEIFEDKLFVSGVIAEPLTLYYSNTGDFTTFTGTDIVKPLGTDSITAMKNYYGQLLVFKRDTTWKLTFIYDSITSLYLPKLELQSGNYGATSNKAVTWVENDIWFFTGREVRAIGFKDQQTGVLGVNSSVISDEIKETLYTISIANQTQAVCFYFNRRFYLSIPLDSSVNDTTFVCHLLYKNNWTKYNNRIKASIDNFVEIDNVIYTTKSVTPFGVLKWDEALYNDNEVAVSSEVFFKKVEDKDFNKFNIYRYLDLMFKNLQGKIKVTIKQDANDIRSEKTRTFYIGQGLENELGSIGETDVGEVLVADSFGQTVDSSPFLKNRISFLSKAQTLTIGLSSSNAGETFTIAEYALFGHKEPRKMFKPGNIISV